MHDLVRCSACRGAKSLPKLGGIVGECDLCQGTGKIKFVAPVVVAPVEVVDATYGSTITPEHKIEIIEAVKEVEPLPANTIKVEKGGRAIYKRKATA